jgi:hypothetical protein
VSQDPVNGSLKRMQEQEPKARNDAPSWGPIGSLLQRQNPTEYERLLRLHEAMLEQDRQRRVA